MLSGIWDMKGLGLPNTNRALFCSPSLKGFYGDHSRFGFIAVPFLGKQPGCIVSPDLRSLLGITLHQGVASCAQL